MDRTGPEVITAGEHALRAGSAAQADDVLAGLRAPRKHLPCRLLYDARGAALFEQICTLDEYYPTRSELALLEAHLPAIAATAGPDARVIEPGSGAGTKTRMLLRALSSPAGYVPIDISREQLEDNARALRAEFPELEVQPVCGDYTSPLELPRPVRPPARTLAFFPGSTIGNFEPAAARAFLARLRELAGARGLLLLGADANRARASLERAYDDHAGVTAAFNRNVLRHLNRRFGFDFQVDGFAHLGFYAPEAGRIEMHLQSMRDQAVGLDGAVRPFPRGARIHTENSYKYTPAEFEALLLQAGFGSVRRWDAPGDAYYAFYAT
jgi:dimethylhistidine N-methyltransferase